MVAALNISRDSEDLGLNDLLAAAGHLEDLEVFAGQRSRMHPGPGWDMVLEMLRCDLEAGVAKLWLLGVTKRFGR
jgi:hypothetical protein